ncbi:SigE family RNA polymerase sigma factor [Nocardioides sediminis]|uniref:SigE family RNA polymerase sigma factor n=1 Tax=Nocardioides sediminis TaxID=433648 RepID=UPI001F2F0C5B|nr:SigE family RNA polymerase sigma factor [Nocardioides sediminis]
MEPDVGMRLELADFVALRRPALLRAAVAITGDEHRAEDVLQAALLRVLPHWSEIRDAAAAEAYVRRAVLHQHISWCRRAAHRHETVRSEVPEPAGGGLGDQAWDQAQPRGRHSDLWRHVAALPPRQRSTVALRFYEGLSVAETATALGCSPGTVKSNTHHALARLRAVVERDDLPVAG